MLYVSDENETMEAEMYFFFIFLEIQKQASTQLGISDANVQHIFHGK